MARVKGGVITHKKHHKILRGAKSMRGGRARKYSLAKMALMKQGLNAYIGRRQRRRGMRTIWISRIQAACRLNGVSYSRFMNGLLKKAILLDRKVLADIAVSEPGMFKKLVEEARGQG